LTPTAQLNHLKYASTTSLGRIVYNNISNPISYFDCLILSTDTILKLRIPYIIHGLTDKNNKAPEPERKDVTVFAPTAFYRKDGQVESIMVEINSSLYMDETSGAKAPAFDSIKKQIRSLLCSIKQFQQQAQPGVGFTKTSHSAVIEKSRNNWDAKRWFAYVSSAIYFSDNLLANFSFVTKDATRIRPDSRSPM